MVIAAIKTAYFDVLDGLLKSEEKLRETMDLISLSGTHFWEWSNADETEGKVSIWMDSLEFHAILGDSNFQLMSDILYVHLSVQ